ncbi:MAG: patatin-like phospholipase family protein, partial [Bacteroidetes bacterium]
GVADTLVKIYGGYKAVMGVSTGSTMGPLILTQNFDLLSDIYSSTTQKDIFNVNPFKVRKVKDTIKTEPRLGLAVFRLVTGKKTIGETKNFRKLIDKFFKEEYYKNLKEKNLVLAVGVTNMSSGNFELHSSENNSYDRMKDWIWASANQPLWMSYVKMDGSDYVDGGLRQVVPLEDAVKFSLKNNIDTIDVIINNSFDPIAKAWNPEKDAWLLGLVRVLGVYGLGTHQYSLRVGKLVADLSSCQDNSDIKQTNISSLNGKDIVINFYFMPSSLAVTYRDELAFDKTKMRQLLLEGKKYFSPVGDLPLEPSLARRTSKALKKPYNPNMMQFIVNKSIVENQKFE